MGENLDVYRHEFRLCGAALVYGAITTGSLWKFLRLTGAALALDLVEYHIDNLPKIMGIMSQMIRTASQASERSPSA